MEPTSHVLIALVIAVAVALLVVLARSRRVLIKLGSGLIAALLCTSLGVLIVNDYYGYYSTWGAAVADLSGSGNSYAVGEANSVLSLRGHAKGRLVVVNLAGKLSGINRQGLVWLPPQYFDPRYRHLRFPAIELFHGTPGDPAQIVNQVRVTEIAQNLIDTRRMGPVVLVMPDSNGGFGNQEECLNTSSFKDDTYVAQDVPADIRAQFRVSRDTAQWGSIGESSGGYCAANLMLRHPGSFGSAASIDGYFRPQDGNAGPVVGSNTALSQANDPLLAALRTRAGSGPLPAFWLAAGTGVQSDYDAAKAMAAAMRRLEPVPFLVMKGADHTMAAIRQAIPSALTWSWQQLANPDERREFPTSPLGFGRTVDTAPLKHLFIVTHRLHKKFSFGLADRAQNH